MNQPIIEKRGTIAPPSLPTPLTRAETIKALAEPIDKRHWRQRKQGNVMLDYVPWAVLAKCLHARTNAWQWALIEVKTIGDTVVVSGRLTISCSDGDLIYEAVSSEPLNTKGAPPVETAASSCLRRAASLSGLGISLWLLDY